MVKIWTQEEVDYVRDNFRQQGARRIALKLGRSVSAVQHKWENGCQVKRLRSDGWTKEQLAYLAEHYPLEGTNAVAKALGKSSTSIRHKASRLNIHADPEQVLIRSHHQLRETWKIRLAGDGVKDINAWKRKVKQRDDFTCADCGLRDPQIMVAHHHVPASESSELARDLSNGVTLCPNCHARRHITIGRGATGKRLSAHDKALILELRSMGYSINSISIDLRIDNKTVEAYLKKIRT